MEKTYKSLGQLTLLISGGVINTILKGYIITYFWLWFIVPIFSVVELSIPQAIGLGVTASLFTKRFKLDKDKEKRSTKDILRIYLKQFVFLLLFFGFSWIITLFL